MDSSNKRDVDFQKGKNTREWLVVFLNQDLLDPYRIERIHSHLRTMHINEKVKNNKVMNRIQSASFLKAMGLDYFLTKKESKMVIPIRFLILDWKKGSIYLKLPSEYIDSWREYLQLLTNLDYHFILADPERKVVSFPIPIKIFIRVWDPKLRSSKGNRNRLDFLGPVSQIGLMPPKQKNIFGDSCITKLTKLFDA